MLKMKSSVLKIVWIIFAVWTTIFISIITYTAVVVFNSPFKNAHDAFAIFTFFLLIAYILSAKGILMRTAKSIEKIGDDLYRVHTLVNHYDIHRKDVTIDKFGRIKIDVYSGKIHPQRGNYIDTTPNKKLWDELLGTTK
jgi:hypothetical protein